VKKPPPKRVGSKTEALVEFVKDSDGETLTTNQGVRIEDDQNTLKGGARGPSLLEDFHFREKITHFDHERIPERVVHARGSGAHGYFEVYKSMSAYTKAQFLQDPALRTPVFVRFSTVAGSRALAPERDAVEFGTEAFRHCKTIGATAEGVELLRACPGIPVSDDADEEDADPGIIVGGNAQVVKQLRRGDGAAPPLDTGREESPRRPTRRGRDAGDRSGAGTRPEGVSDVEPRDSSCCPLKKVV
jgi:Catalase